MGCFSLSLEWRHEQIITHGTNLHDHRIRRHNRCIPSRRAGHDLKVIATGRNEAELQELRSLGADAVIAFNLGALHPLGEKDYEQSLKEAFAQGVNVVLDYLWGGSAKTVIVAIAKAVEDATPVRFVHVGGASGEDQIGLPGAALRSSAIQLMGSGLKSIPLPKLLSGVKNVFEAAGPAKLQIAVQTMPLSEIEVAWKAPNKPRIVVAI